MFFCKKIGQTNNVIPQNNFFKREGVHKMSVKILPYGSFTLASIEGDIDHHTAKDIRENIDSYIEKNSPKMLKMDFGQVKFMDSSGIGLIMGRFKLMNALKGKLKVINVPTGLERMIRLSGLMSLGIFEKE